MTDTLNPGDLFSLDGRVAVVTGGCRGVGAMVAEGLVAAGCTVYISSRTAEECAKTAADLSGLPGACIPIPGDVSTSEGIGAIVGAVSEREDAVHLLVNNAGIVRRASIEEFTMDAWDQVLGVNLRASFFVTQQMLPLLRAASTPDRHASVINMSSITATKTGAQRDYPYRASKAGLNQLTRMMAKDLAGDNITVNAIAPGFFRSAMTGFMLDNHVLYERFVSRNPIPREGRLEEIAGLAVYLASRAGGYVTGTVIEIDGGLRFID